MVCFGELVRGFESVLGDLNETILDAKVRDVIEGYGVAGLKESGGVDA